MNTKDTNESKVLLIVSTHTTRYVQHYERIQLVLEMKDTFHFKIQLPYFTDEEAETHSLRKNDLLSVTHFSQDSVLFEMS